LSYNSVDEEREGNDVGEAIVTIMAAEAIYLENNATWIR